MAIVLGLDCSWKCTGWALCGASGPIKVGYMRLSSKTWRMAALRGLLHDLEREIAELQAYSRPEDPPPLVAIERAPKVYGSRGNQSATAFGLGEITGACELWACRPTWAYPWLVPVATWRGWWGIKAKGRIKAKAAALRVAIKLPGARDLLLAVDPSIARLDRPGGPTAESLAEEPVVDVAEAILQGVGAARQLVARYTSDPPPKGPQAWARARADGSAYTPHPRQPELAATHDPRRSR